jgi:hypothetical protein
MSKIFNPAFFVKYLKNGCEYFDCKTAQAGIAIAFSVPVYVFFNK